MVLLRISIFTFLTFLSLCLTLISCSWKPVKRLHVVEDFDESPVRRNDQSLCSGSEVYIPWDGMTSISPKRTIRLNIHFMNSRDGSKNLRGDAAISFAQDLILSANQSLANNHSMRLPLDNKLPVLDPLIQYELVKKDDGLPAIYEHFDDDFYYLVKQGPYRNNYDRSVIDKYGIGLDSILNVFIQVPPPDRMMSNNYGGLKTGVAIRNGIRISGPLLTDSRVWTYKGMFNHEVGHILGLRHSWLPDRCDDTPEHPNCWNFTNDGSPCDSLVSNNVMDSNADQNAWTPCQIGIMQQTLIENRRYQRSFVIQDYCIKQDDEPVVIHDSIIWCREMDVVSDVVIGKNGQLTISNRVSMPQGSRIYIENGGELMLKKNAKLENACGLDWDGIYSKSPKKRQVVMEEGAKIILND